MLHQLLALLHGPRDGATLRFTIGQVYFAQHNWEDARFYYASALESDPHYSAAWKMLGRALEKLGRCEEAAAVYQQGIAAADQNKDQQAAKEMRIFLQRLQKKSDTS